MLSGSRTVGVEAGMSAGWVTTYWCLMGTIGTSTPASAPTLPAAAPAQFTTVSAVIVHSCASGPGQADGVDGPVGDVDPGDPHPRHDAHAKLGRPLRQRPGQRRGVEPAVARQPQRGEDVLGR
ncbi:hypothetical protein GCM10020219_067110 [Nonomuraea dietziae]